MNTYHTFIREKNTLKRDELHHVHHNNNKAMNLSAYMIIGKNEEKSDETTQKMSIVDHTFNVPNYYLHFIKDPTFLKTLFSLNLLKCLIPSINEHFELLELNIGPYFYGTYLQTNVLGFHLDVNEENLSKYIIFQELIGAKMFDVKKHILMFRSFNKCIHTFSEDWIVLNQYNQRVKNKTIECWHQLRRLQLTDEKIMCFIDQIMHSKYHHLIHKDLSFWDSICELETEHIKIKKWLNHRLQWMDKNFGYSKHDHPLLDISSDLHNHLMNEKWLSFYLNMFWISARNKSPQLTPIIASLMNNLSEHEKNEKHS